MPLYDDEIINKIGAKPNYYSSADARRRYTGGNAQDALGYFKGGPLRA